MSIYMGGNTDFGGLKIGSDRDGKWRFSSATQSFLNPFFAAASRCKKASLEPFWIKSAGWVHVKLEKYTKNKVFFGKKQVPTRDFLPKKLC